MGGSVKLMFVISRNGLMVLYLRLHNTQFCVVR